MLLSVQQQSSTVLCSCYLPVQYSASCLHQLEGFTHPPLHAILGLIYYFWPAPEGFFFAK